MSLIAVFLAFVVKGLCGFANTLVFGSVMSFRTDNVNISPIDLVLGLPSNLVIAWRERAGVRARVWMPLALLVIAGTIPGALLLRGVDAGLLKAVFGFVVAALGVESLLRQRAQGQKKSSRAVLAAIGVASGVLCGLFGVGAFLVAYISRTTSGQREFRGNLCAVFVAENLFRFALYIATGILTMEIFRDAVLLLPAMAAGLAVGMLLSRRVSDMLAKRIVNGMLILMGVTLVINSLAG